MTTSNLSFVSSFIVESWLPNVEDKHTKDLHTGYITNIQFLSLDGTTSQVWQCVLRYNTFKEFNYQYVQRFYSSFVFNDPFPATTLNNFFFGLTDEIRQERMLKLDRWLHEIINHPVIMTDIRIMNKLYDMCDFHTHVK